MYPYYYIPAKKFSSREIRELLISVIALTFAFSFAFSDIMYNRDVRRFIYILPVSFAAVSTAFLLHEIGHKIVAQKYGCWAEYRMYPRGLLLALILSFFGFVFAAPGAVYITGNVDSERNGKISAAGPLTNILIALVFLPFVLFLNPSFIWFLCAFVCLINIILGGFNMVPFYPLDGSKIFRWSKMVWAGMLIIIVMLGVTIYPYYALIFSYL
ncbi:MAG: site-2 protease family protein [Candidatus Thermoplasmatota archaeon]|nr:site-2 protease family protein [Candidatus Thermoplasmatota archaeon]